jgi:hypothetical protein
MPDNDITPATVGRLLVEAGGPSELAEQLIAIGRQHELITELPRWIMFHTGQEWSGQQFAEWCVKFRRFDKALKAKAAELKGKAE